MKRLLLVIFLLVGCATSPVIRNRDTTVKGTPGQEGTTLKTEDKKAGFVIPAKSTYTVTTVAAHADQPAQAVAVWTFSEPSFYEEALHYTVANTGKINTEVAKQKLDANERKPLLYGALVCLALTAVAIWKAYPTGAYLTGGSAVVLFLAWKLDDMPDWFWMIGLAATAIAAGLYFGYEKKEQHLKEGK